MQPEAVTESALAELRAGVVDVFPAAVAVVPFGLLLGALAAQQGLSPLEVLVMSATVFAGSSQFVAVKLWSDPAPWLLVTVSALMVNCRHVLMGASLAPKIRHIHGFRSLVTLFLMADEVWALAEQRAVRRRLTFAYYLGLGGFLYLNWVAWNGVGAVVGALLEDPAAYGFDFAFTAIFLTLLVDLGRGPRSAVAIAASAGVATATYLLVDGPWYIAAGGLAGALAGALVGPARRPLDEPAP
ncbi:4-azaleucine resistance probable transporter AzlC [Tistlia consotensis]|uniref:4-azaleucine resistance probable transporter AzlC n=1 Tax=Tistlia consotensis USBA 355 TaxID=560819 RepID=A0A1Y6B8R6_9PROT|nr:AzlC family ABC transporter permease [Tistlia consotensis]SME90375.1 4-azaleucine resistance probable transporter AzlC [Tistlia consotensis USBA 355]SNR26692.1 4-azaleucine resistance probable transporter AzlC [Tistlia consotensis]